MQRTKMELQQRKSRPNFPPRHSRITKKGRPNKQNNTKKRGQGNKRSPKTVTDIKMGWLPI